MKAASGRRSSIGSASRIRRTRARRLLTLAFVVSVALSFVAGEKVGARAATSADRARDHASEALQSSQDPKGGSAGDRGSLELEGGSGIGADGNTQLK